VVNRSAFFGATCIKAGLQHRTSKAGQDADAWFRSCCQADEVPVFCARRVQHLIPERTTMHTRYNAPAHANQADCRGHKIMSKY